MPHVGEDTALFRGDSSSGIGAPVFRLAAERADDMDAGGVGRDGVIDEDGGGLVHTQKVVGSGNGSGLRAREIRRVRKDTQDHVGGAINLSAVGVRGNVAKQTVKTTYRCQSWSSLL